MNDNRQSVTHELVLSRCPAYPQIAMAMGILGDSNQGPVRFQWDYNRVNEIV